MLSSSIFEKSWRIWLYYLESGVKENLLRRFVNASSTYGCIPCQHDRRLKVHQLITSRNMFFCLMIAGFKLKCHFQTPDCQVLGMLFERGRLGAIWPRSPRFAKVFRPSGTDACRKHIPSFVVCLVGKVSSAWFVSFGCFFLIFVCYPCRCTWSHPFLPKRVPRPKATKIDQFLLLNSCWRISWFGAWLVLTSKFPLCVPFVEFEGKLFWCFWPFAEWWGHGTKKKFKA